MIGIVSGALSTGLGFMTGGNVVRMMYTLIIGVALGSVGAWKLQAWRYEANAADQRVAEADARIAQAKESLRAIERAQDDQRQTGVLYEQVNQQLGAERAQRARDRADRDGAIERVFDAAGCRAAGAGVPPGAARQRGDEKPAGGGLEPWLPEFR